MVNRRSDASGSEDGPPSGWSHDWHPYEDYLNIHARYMRHLFDAGTVVRDHLVFTEIRDAGELRFVHIAGRIECSNGVVIEADKWLAVRRGRSNRHEVKGVSYSYHAWRQGVDKELLRYDTSHGMDSLHRHAFDRATGDEIEIQPIRLEELPTLAGVIEEAVRLAESPEER